MLHQILALARDPDDAETIQMAQLAASFEALTMLSQDVTLEQYMSETAPALRGLMLIPQLLPLMLRHLQNSAQSSGRPLGERALDRLPKTVLDSAAIDMLQRKDDGAVCAICYEEYVVGKRVLRLPCGHLFCATCCLQWLHRNCTCPVCRREVVDEENSNDGNEWRSEDSFPFRGLVQGSPLTAVRRARALQEGLPMHDMTPIAEQHSSVQTSQRETAPSGSLALRDAQGRPPSVRSLEDIPIADDMHRTQVASRNGPAPALSQESPASNRSRGSSSLTMMASRLGHEALPSERHDRQPFARSTSSLAQEDETSSRSQRRQQGALTNIPNDRSNARASSRRLSALQRPAPADGATSFLMRMLSPRAASNSVRDATNARSAGASTPALRAPILRRRSGLQSNGITESVV